MRGSASDNSLVLYPCNIPSIDIVGLQGRMCAMTTSTRAFLRARLLHVVIVVVTRRSRSPCRSSIINPNSIVILILWLLSLSI